MKQAYIKPEMSVEQFLSKAVLISATNAAAIKGNGQLSKEGSSFKFEKEDTDEDY